ncbi:6-phosphogluconolactonase [Acidisarcina polymorpha]|uniref:6-phosphogluconolactonase n=1 Tax=Acidisarcina polymorpha TaxID=2211140 RepID=A0A2Z5FYM6_9BACT|nr:lactonase family protein [Acidisarcina polymorpha]AXC11567.1 6-phosphogluconolactonase [Acidisarcina polymorpha]
MAVAPWLAHDLAWAKASGDDTLFVGTGTNTGSKGIYAYRFDAAKGSLESLGVAAEAPSPSFLALSPDGKVLFAVNEVDSYQGAKTGAVSSYALDRGAGKLTLINTVASGGSGPCHLTTDHTGRVLLVANYSGGSAASFQIGADGKLSEAVSEFHYPSNGPGAGQDKERQNASHAHRATVPPGNRFVLINDLGLDCIHIYHLDAATAKLTANDPAEWRAAAGSGPRALRFHPSGRWAYCVNELTSTVDQLSWDGAAGSLKLIEETALLPEGFHGISRASEIVFDRKGAWAYVANRDNDFLDSFAVDPGTGKLSSLQRTPCGGKIPRHIALGPSQHWLLVANQDSNLIAVYRRDVKTGRLAATGQSFPIQSPQCLLFA